MTEDMIWKQVEIARGRTLSVMEGVSEEMADVIPAGFRNNIRWNAGHIFTIQELLVFYFAKEPMTLPDGYREMFANGTSPADWKDHPPNLETLRSLLQEQTIRIKNTFSGRMDEKVPKPFKLGEDLQLETIGELIMFTLYHEGTHVGFINGIKKSILSVERTA